MFLPTRQSVDMTVTFHPMKALFLDRVNLATAEKRMKELVETR